jgi:hypothetical protein
MSATKNKIRLLLNGKYPDLNLREDGEGFICSAEDGITAADGFPLFDYWNEDYKEVRYVFGTHEEIRDILDANGWWSEWQDAGTMRLIPD